jgi:hypothetical protein
MRHVVAYRDRYQVTDRTDPLGPGGQAGERGDAYAITARALEAITATEPRPVVRAGPRPMERVPVVLADARAHAERMQREADERARRDHAEREREPAVGRGW